MADSTGRDARPRSDRPIYVPQIVAAAVVQRWGEAGSRWLADVMPEFIDLCRARSAEVRTVFPARYGFVAEVVAGDQLLVMRSTPDPDGRFQAQAALGLAAIGVSPTVHEVVHTPTGTWTVMDRVRPGTPAASPDDDQLAALLRPLAAAKPPAPDLPRLVDWLHDRLVDDLLADLPPGLAPAPEHERAAALSLLAEIASEEADGLCHGDCSWGNVLQGPRGLVLIDPRGKGGDVAYDVGVLAFKRGRDPRDLARRVGVDPERAAAWSLIGTAARV